MAELQPVPARLTRPGRQRMTTSCDFCCGRKIKCDAKKPACTNCEQAGRVCETRRQIMKRGRKTRQLRSSDRSVDVPNQAAAELPSSPLAEVDQSGPRRCPPPVRHLEPLAQGPEDNNGDGFHNDVDPDDERASPGEGPAAQTSCLDESPPAVCAADDHFQSRTLWQRLQAAGVRSSDAVTYIGATLELFYANIYPIFPVLYRPDADRALDAMRWQPQEGGIWSDRAFSLLAAVCAYTLAVLPPSVSGANWAISEAFFQASKSSLDSYAVADIEKPNSSSVFIRHLHAAWQYTAGRSDVSWYIMGEAIRLALSMRLFDERSYDAMEYIEAQMCRRAFWLLYSSDKSAAVSGRRVIGLSRTLFQRVIPPAYPADLGDQDRVSMTTSDGLEQEFGLSSGFNANHDLWRASEELLAHDDEAAGNPMPESHFVTRIDQNFRCLSAAYYRFQTCLEGLPFVLGFHDAFDATVHSFRFRAADEVRAEVPLALRIQRSNLQITYQALKMVCLRKYPSLFRSPRLDCLDMPAVSIASACSPAGLYAADIPSMVNGSPSSHVGTLDSNTSVSHSAATVPQPEAPFRRHAVIEETIRITRDILFVIHTSGLEVLRLNGEACADKIRIVGASILELLAHQPLGLASTLSRDATKYAELFPHILAMLDSKAADQVGKERG